MSDDQTPAHASPAGWYPEGVNGLRYWDGSAWTDHRAPTAAAATAVPTPVRGKRTRNYLGDVSLALVIMGLLLGFVILRQSQVGFVVTIIGCITAIMALVTARGRRSLITAIIAISAGGAVVGAVLLITALWFR